MAPSIGRAQIGIVRSVNQQVIGDGQDGVADRHGRLLLAAPGDESVVLRAKVGVSGSTASVCCLDECGAEPGITLARLAARAFARALVVARTHASPGGEVSRGRESGHIQPDLGHQDLGDPTTHAWDGVQSVQGVLKRAQPLLHFGAEPLDELVEGVQMSQLLGEREALV